MSAREKAMPTRLSRQLSATPSLHLTTSSENLKQPVSTTPSLTTSPTSSSAESIVSTDLSSFSQPDGYGYKMHSHSDCSADAHADAGLAGLDGKHELESRRSSTRARKPTAKAQKLESSDFFSRRRSTNIPREVSPPRNDTFSTLEADTAELDDLPNSGGDVTPPNTISVKRPSIVSPEESYIIVDPPLSASKSSSSVHGEQEMTSNSEDAHRRASRRERKPTAKVISSSTSSPPLKRHAPPEEDTPVRKSLRLSYNGPKVPSRLRYSMPSSCHNSGDEADISTPPGSELPAFSNPPSSQKSLIVTLKSERLSQFFDSPQSSRSQRLRLRRAAKQSKSSESLQSKVQRQQQASFPSANIGTCNLSCLQPGERLYIMARVAMMMPDPDTEDENQPVIPGSASDYRIYTAQFCKCHKLPAPDSDGTESLELEQALLPNAIANGTDTKPGSLSTAQQRDAGFLVPTDNKNHHAGKEEKISGLFNTVSKGCAQTGRDFPFSNDSQPATNMVPPSRSHSSHPRRSTGSMPPPLPVKRSFEDRTRDDHKALSEARKRASVEGMSWTFNMTVGEIEELLSRKAQLELGLPVSHAPGNQKGSRFRVDPRGLRGQSPGGGTIIMRGRK